MDAELLGLVM